MNRVYRRQRHIYDASRKYYLLGRDRVIDRLNPGAADHVLEIGCGTARNLVLAARQYPDAHFFGVDVSTEMLTSARGAIRRAGLSPRIRVAHADATAFDPLALFGMARFERIFISYALSMMPRWDLVLDTAIARLAPGGELHIVDFGGQEGLPRWFAHALRRWLALFHVTPREELSAWLAQRAERMGATLTVERLYLGYALYARLKPPSGS